MVFGSNPVMNEKAFAPKAWHDAGRAVSSMTESRTSSMTVRGTAVKTGVLVLICTVVAAIVFQQTNAGATWAGPAMFGGMIAALVLSLIICFKKTTAPYLAPVHAVAEGVFLGAISAFIASRFAEGAVLVGQAIGITFAIAFSLAALYTFGLVRISGTVAKIIIVATMGVMLLYLAQIVLGCSASPSSPPSTAAGPSASASASSSSCSPRPTWS